MLSCSSVNLRRLEVAEFVGGRQATFDDDPMTERALLVVNRAAATGHSVMIADRLRGRLGAELGPEINLSLAVVQDHPAATIAVRDYLENSDAPALIIAGGGGGTLRAVIEGICDGCEVGRLPQRDCVRLAALRMGSGNVLAKQFGAPRDAAEGMKGIAASLRADCTEPCCVMRVEIGRHDQSPDVRYAATLGGFGQFGRVPGDLARWHRRLPTFHKLMARVLGIERMTNIEYGLALLVRSVSCALWPKQTEQIKIRIGDRTETLRLLAGAVLNFDLSALPLDSEVSIGDPALSLRFVSHTGRLATLGLVLAAKLTARHALNLEIESGARLEIELVDRSSAEFFLDEDPLTFHEKLTVQVAGTLAFVPGAIPIQPMEKGRYHDSTCVHSGN